MPLTKHFSIKATTHGGRKTTTNSSLTKPQRHCHISATGATSLRGYPDGCFTSANRVMSHSRNTKGSAHGDEGFVSNARNDKINSQLSLWPMFECCCKRIERMARSSRRWLLNRIQMFYHETFYIYIRAMNVFKWWCDGKYGKIHSKPYRRTKSAAHQGDILSSVWATRYLAKCETSKTIHSDSQRLMAHHCIIPFSEIQC